MARIRGTDEPDILEGTNDADRITAQGGDDVVEANGGNDFVRGSSGKDQLNGGSGNDDIAGGPGADNIDGGPGADRIAGADGDDILFGGPGRDSILGGEGDDIIEGGPGGNIQYYGGPGNDTIFSLSWDGEPVPFMDPAAQFNKNEPFDVDNDLLIGADDNDVYHFRWLIDATDEVLARNTDPDGNINYRNIAMRENGEVHAHWVESLGNDVVNGFEKDRDSIILEGHTVYLVRANDPNISEEDEATYGIEPEDYSRYIDYDGDGQENDTLLVFKSINLNRRDAGMPLGAHDGDDIGTVVFRNEKLDIDALTVVTDVHFGLEEPFDDNNDEPLGAPVEPGGGSGNALPPADDLFTFQLYNARTDTPIDADLTPGETVQVTSTELGELALVAIGDVKGPVFLELEGASPNRSTRETDGPFALDGDIGDDDFISGAYREGSQTFSATDTASGATESVTFDLVVANGGNAPLEFRGSRYEVVGSSSDWTDAQSQAEAAGGTLVRIDSRAENNFIIDNLWNGQAIFLDASDAASEGTWTDSDGDALSFTNWLPGEPNNSGNQDYARMASADGGWDDGGLTSTGVLTGDSWTVPGPGLVVAEFDLVA